MHRRTYLEWLPQVGLVIGSLILALALHDAPRAMGPGLDIALGSGLQGTGSNGAPLDITNGTSNGQTVAWNGSQYVIDKYCGNPSLRYCFTAEFEQFLTNCTTVYPGFIGSATGAGSGCTPAIVDGHPGILALHTGTTATGNARMLSNNTVITFGGNIGESCIRELVSVPVLSTIVIEYLVRIGFMDSATSALSVDAIQAVYDRPNTGDFWALQTCSNSACTLKPCDGSGGTTAAPIVAANWYTLEKCVASDGTSATLSVNGTVCATNTTNIPTGISRTTGYGAQAVNNTGAVPADENFFVDYMQVSLPFGVAR